MCCLGRQHIKQRHDRGTSWQPLLARRPFEDAFAAAQKEASPEPTAAGRRRKLTAKGRSRAVDPATSRAEHILALGGPGRL